MIVVLILCVLVSSQGACAMSHEATSTDAGGLVLDPVASPPPPDSSRAFDAATDHAESGSAPARIDCASDPSGVPIRPLSPGKSDYRLHGWSSELLHPDNPEQYAIGDLTGDGRADIVGVDEWSGVRIFVQRADGGLAAPLIVEPVLADNFGVALIDLADDSAMELVITDTSNITVYRSLGEGKVEPIAAYESSGAYGIVAKDVNADGLPDIVGRAGDHLVVFLQGEGGRLERGADVDIRYREPDAREWCMGDVTGDGFDDLVVVLQHLRSGVEVHAFDPITRTFAHNVVSYPFGDTYNISCAIGDFNADGLGDLVVAEDMGYDSQAWLLEQDESGTLLPPRPLGTASYGGGRVIALDLDRDGFDDLVRGQASAFSLTVSLQRHGELGVPVSYDYPRHNALNTVLLAADVSCDGCMDIVGANSNGLVVLYGSGCGQ